LHCCGCVVRHDQKRLTVWMSRCVAQERAMNFGASILAPIYECLPDLLKPRQGAEANGAKADGAKGKGTKRQKR